MPGRATPLVTNQIYHVFNRGIDKRPTFVTKRQYNRALQTINFYRFPAGVVKLSKYLEYNSRRQSAALSLLQNPGSIVEILAFCLMPNHYHLLLRQTKDRGISKFIGNFQNSYTKYFNRSNQKDGAIFLNQFKAVRVEDDEQLIHVSRYIHLNPFTSYLVTSPGKLEGYPWSSLAEYTENQDGFTEKSLILDLFKDKTTYRDFVLNQADYQKTLHQMQHLILE